MSETVKAWVQTSDESYFVWAPADLAQQLGEVENRSVNEGWVSLALVDVDEYICLRAVHIIWFRRLMTFGEIQRKHSLAMAEK